LAAPSNKYMVGSLKMNTALEYSTRVVQEGDRRCKKSTFNDLAYLTPLRIPLMNPVIISPSIFHLNRVENGKGNSSSESHHHSSKSSKGFYLDQELSIVVVKIFESNLVT